MGYIMDLRQLVGTRPLIMAGACVIVIDPQDRILLQLRTDNGMWGLPGGSMEPGESMEVVAKREMFEETGLLAGELILFNVFSGKEFYYQYPHGDEVFNVVAAYICKNYQGDIKSDETEVMEVSFFNLNEIPEAISPPDRPIIEKYKEHKEHGNESCK